MPQGGKFTKRISDFFPIYLTKLDLFKKLSLNLTFILVYLIHIISLFYFYMEKYIKTFCFQNFFVGKMFYNCSL
jgi:hypothetical protein